MKNLLLKINNIFLFFGLNISKIIELRFIPKYIYQRYIFILKGGKIDRTQIELGGYTSQAGEVKSQYFTQDLLVANYIFELKSRKHLDVGSRIDGFVAHVASFRELDVMDIRQLNISIKNINFIIQDLNKVDKKYFDSYDSISCLHALEHIGLGRYGDEVDPNGHIKGFNNLYNLLKTDGILYISFPIGSNKIYFNSQRIFNPNEILIWCKDKFEIINFDYVDDHGKLHRSANLNKLPKLLYGCGIYKLRKAF